MRFHEPTNPGGSPLSFFWILSSSQSPMSLSKLSGIPNKNINLLPQKIKQLIDNKADHFFHPQLWNSDFSLYRDKDRLDLPGLFPDILDNPPYFGLSCPILPGYRGQVQRQRIRAYKMKFARIEFTGLGRISIWILVPREDKFPLGLLGGPGDHGEGRENRSGEVICMILPDLGKSYFFLSPCELFFIGGI